MIGAVPSSPAGHAAAEHKPQRNQRCFSEKQSSCEIDLALFCMMVNDFDPQVTADLFTLYGLDSFSSKTRLM